MPLPCLLSWRPPCAQDLSHTHTRTHACSHTHTHARACTQAHALPPCAQDLTTTLHAAASLPPALLTPRALARLAASADACHPHLDVHGLIITLWALARLRLQVCG